MNRITEKAKDLIARMANPPDEALVDATKRHFDAAATRVAHLNSAVRELCQDPDVASALGLEPNNSRNAAGIFLEMAGQAVEFYFSGPQFGSTEDPVLSAKVDDEFMTSKSVNTKETSVEGIKKHIIELLRRIPTPESRDALVSSAQRLLENATERPANFGKNISGTFGGVPVSLSFSPEGNFTVNVKIAEQNFRVMATASDLHEAIAACLRTNLPAIET